MGNPEIGNNHQVTGCLDPKDFCMFGNSYKMNTKELIRGTPTPLTLLTTQESNMFGKPKLRDLVTLVY